MNKILKTLMDTGAILEGHFLLTSGRHSNKYVEKFRLIEQPKSLDFVCCVLLSSVELFRLF